MGRTLEIPRYPHEQAMIALGIPPEDLGRARRTSGLICFPNGQTIPVEYPFWWRGWDVVGFREKRCTLLSFVFEHRFPNPNPDRFVTLELEDPDLGQIPLEKLQGVQAIKLP